MQLIKDDIETNYNDIILNIEDEPFNKILSVIILVI